MFAFFVPINESSQLQASNTIDSEQQECSVHMYPVVPHYKKTRLNIDIVLFSTR